MTIRNNYRSLSIVTIFICCPLISLAGPDSLSGPAFSIGDSSAVSVVATGDMMLGARARTVIKSRGVNYPFEALRDYTEMADIAIANLEAPFTDGGEPYPKKYNFKVPASFITGPMNAGFDVMTLANNHILDFGLEGLASTLDLLDSVGVAYCGAGMDRESAWRPAIITRKSQKFAILAFTLTYPDSFWANSQQGGTAYVTRSQMRSLLKKANNYSDYQIVSFHWGAESRNTPKKYQRQYAREAIDAGADLIIGHHPHVLQGIEIYKNRLIVYSLGNFVFGSYSYRANDSALLWVEFGDQMIMKAQILPINVQNSEVQFQPRLLEKTERIRVIQTLNEWSSELNSGKAVLDSEGYIKLFTPGG